ASAIADRPGNGAGGLRADAEDAALVHIGDGAAAGADGVDIDHGDHGLVVADLGVQQVSHAQFALVRDADVRGGAADVEGDDGVDAGRLAGPYAAAQPADGT